MKPLVPVALLPDQIEAPPALPIAERAVASIPGPVADVFYVACASFSFYVHLIEAMLKEASPFSFDLRQPAQQHFYDDADVFFCPPPEKTGLDLFLADFLAQP